MIKKVTTPIIEKSDTYSCLTVVGTKVEYRIFGILLYMKILYLPLKYGVKEYLDYYIRI